MSSSTIFPNDVLRAVEQAKLAIPEDVNGFSAFRIVTDQPKTIDKNTYYWFEINLDGKWRKIILKLENIRVCGRIQELETIRGIGKNIPDISLLFRGDSTFESLAKAVYDKETGELTFETEVQEYGKAKCAISDAFVFHANAFKASNPFVYEKYQTTPLVVRQRIITKEGKKEVMVLDSPNINVKIAFAKGTADADKKKPETKFDSTISFTEKFKNEKGVDSVRKIPATVVNPENPEGEPEEITNKNIHLIFPPGSEISAIESLLYVCEASTGRFSIPAKLKDIIVNPCGSGASENSFSEMELAFIASRAGTNAKKTEAVEVKNNMEVQLDFEVEDEEPTY